MLNSLTLLQAMNGIYDEDILMAEKNTADRTQRSHIKARRGITIALAAALVLALGIGTYAVKPSIFGWKGNFEIRETEKGTESYLYTDHLTDPVELEDERLWFVVNDEHIDITDLISEDEPFLYNYTDEEGIIHYWIVGKNGPKPGNWGYGEFLYQPGANWIGGYSARANLDKEGHGPAWLEKGKEELNIPW